MNKIDNIIKDEYYQGTSDNLRLRIAVRAILERDDKKIAYLHIKGKDAFGDRDHLESPGGGVDEGETLQEALKRELSEELGANIQILDEIGYIDIEYKLLNRIDRENYFYCKLVDFKKKPHLLDYEKGLFNGLKWLTCAEAISSFSNSNIEKVGKMIHQREKKVLEYAMSKNIIKELF